MLLLSDHILDRDFTDDGRTFLLLCWKKMAFDGAKMICWLVLEMLLMSVVCRRDCNLPRAYRGCTCDSDETWIDCWDSNIRRLPQVERRMWGVERMTMTGCDITFLVDGDLERFPSLKTLDVRQQSSGRCVDYDGANERNVTMLGLCPPDEEVRSEFVGFVLFTFFFCFLFFFLTRVNAGKTLGGCCVG